MKVIKSVSVDEDLWEAAMDSGFSPSQLMQIVLELVDSENMDYFKFDVQFAVIKDRIESQKIKVEETRQLMEAQAIELKMLEMQLERLQDDYIESEASLELSRLYSNINQVAAVSDFNVDIVEKSCSQTISRIKMLNPEFDLESHIFTLKCLI
jgi:hypothetical protein